MPSYLGSFTLKSITEPTGSNVGSAAIDAFLDGDARGRHQTFAVGGGAESNPRARRRRRARIEEPLERQRQHRKLRIGDRDFVQPHERRPTASSVTKAFHRNERASRIRRENSSGVSAAAIRTFTIVEDTAMLTSRAAASASLCAAGRMRAQSGMRCAPIIVHANQRPHHVGHSNGRSSLASWSPELIAPERELKQRDQPMFEIRRQPHAA